MMANISRSSFQKIHFIRIIDFNYSNTGDIYSSPLFYTQEFFKNYSVVTHNLSTVKYSHISRDDVVVIGGGGLLNYNPWFNFNVAINRILSLCDNVVLWGAGFNSKINSDGSIPKHTPEVDLARFALYGVRDRNYRDYNFVPCASSMSPLLQEAYDTIPKNRIGSILREDSVRNEDSLVVEGVKNITHYNNYNTVIDFIADHEYIITTSYHGALWATLANRKVIVPSTMKWGFKYNYVGVPLCFIDDVQNKDKLAAAIDSVTTHPDLLAQYRDINLAFFDEVKKLVTRVIPEPNKHYEYFYNQNEAAETYFKLTRPAT